MTLSPSVDTPTGLLDSLLLDTLPSWEHSFPSADMIAAAAGLLTPLRGWDGSEGPRARLVFGPGVVQVARRDAARSERAFVRAREAAWTRAQLGAADLLLEHRLEQADELVTATGLLADQGVVGFDQVESAGAWADHLQGRIDRLDADDAPAATRITSWSRKSRANMVRTLAGLDYGPLFADRDALPAMLTLTYPGRWREVAPTAAACKGHMDSLRKRWVRAWGTSPLAVWKREFQRRGAPHYHLLVVPPRGYASGSYSDLATRQVHGGGMFREWVSLAWAEIVGKAEGRSRGLRPGWSCGGCPTVQRLTGHFSDLDSRRVRPGSCCEFHRHVSAGTGVDYAEGMRASDPKRLAVYFSKHGAFSAKDYQNDAPSEWIDAGGSVGRFWGVWGLAAGTRTVELTAVEALAAARTMRRWQRANGYRVQRTVWRANSKTGELRPRKSGVWVGSRMRGSAGFVTVNDGAAFVSTLARLLDQVRERAQAAELDAWIADPERLRALDRPEKCARDLERVKPSVWGIWRGVPFRTPEQDRDDVRAWMRRRGFDPDRPAFPPWWEQD